MTEERPAGDVFTVTALGDGQVRLDVAGIGSELEMTMSPEAARWLGWELACAARLPFPPPLRIARRES